MKRLLALLLAVLMICTCITLNPGTASAGGKIKRDYSVDYYYVSDWESLKNSFNDYYGTFNICLLNDIIVNDDTKDYVISADLTDKNIGLDLNGHSIKVTSRQTATLFVLKSTSMGCLDIIDTKNKGATIELNATNNPGMAYRLFYMNGPLEVNTYNVNYGLHFTSGATFIESVENDIDSEMFYIINGSLNIKSGSFINTIKDGNVLYYPSNSDGYYLSIAGDAVLKSSHSCISLTDLAPAYIDIYDAKILLLKDISEPRIFNRNKDTKMIYEDVMGKNLMLNKYGSVYMSNKTGNQASEKINSWYRDLTFTCEETKQAELSEVTFETVHVLQTYETGAFAGVAEHKWNTPTTFFDPPTCTREGILDRAHCTVCGCENQEDVAVPPTGHDYWLSAYQPATALATGIKEYVCHTCGERTSVTLKKLTPTIKLSATSKTIKVKKTYTLVISKLAKADYVSSVTTSSKKIATVSKVKKNYYKITGKKKGKATITVKLKSGKKATCKVTVK